MVVAAAAAVVMVTAAVKRIKGDGAGLVFIFWGARCYPSPSPPANDDRKTMLQYPAARARLYLLAFVLAGANTPVGERAQGKHSLTDATRNVCIMSRRNRGAVLLVRF